MRNFRHASTSTLEEGFKYRPDYEWPEVGTEQDCPRCGESLELVENKKLIMENHGGALLPMAIFTEDLNQAEIDSKKKNDLRVWDIRYMILDIIHDPRYHSNII